ncbi:TPA: hypothetical protein OTZ30_003694 [Vibrio cholerae]|nr:hypothetical protein [Vibrio cholerae]
MLTVIAHFNLGHADPFPETVKGISGEGSFYVHPVNKQGGFIMNTYDTNDVEMLVEAFKSHLKENDLTALMVHQKGDVQICYSETNGAIY